MIDQLIKDKETLLQLDDEQVENFCRTVSKPGGGGEGHQIPKMAVTCLQLLVYYVKHLDRTDRLRFMSILAGNVGDISATCRRHATLSANIADMGCLCRQHAVKVLA